MEVVLHPEIAYSQLPSSLRLARAKLMANFSRPLLLSGAQALRLECTSADTLRPDLGACLTEEVRNQMDSGPAYAPEQLQKLDEALWSLARQHEASMHAAALAAVRNRVRCSLYAALGQEVLADLHRQQLAALALAPGALRTALKDAMVSAQA